MKLKDFIYVLIFGVIMISILGLLMAWSDGYLDGTKADAVLRVLFPSIVSASLLTRCFSFWLRDYIGIEWWVLIWFLLVVAITVFILLSLPEIVYMSVAVGGIVFISLTCIFMWIWK